MIKKSARLLLGSLLIVLTGFFLNYFSINGKAWEIDQTGTASYIVDGDTLDVSSIGRIRLADIQCPEIGDPDSTEATQYLTSLVYQKEVYVDVDDITGTDLYGRIVAVIYVYYNETHLINVNKALLEEGHAEIWNFDNNEFNPYDWTLYVVYQSEPDPEPDPDPEPPPDNPPDDSPSDEPPPDDSTERTPPSDDNSDNQWISLAINITLGIGIAAGLVALTGWLLVKYTNIGVINSKDKLKKPQKGMISKEQTFTKEIEYNDDPIINFVISNLFERYSNIIIAIYGIGSYFDESLPSGWQKNDLDILVIVNSLVPIPKQEWTDVRYEIHDINENHVWLGFNTIEAYQNNENFSKESFSNYEWSLIELKHPTNSKLLYGRTIRNQLPETNDLKFNYDDVLARGLYHLEKFLSKEDSSTAKQEFSKAVFKIVYFICIFLDPNYRNTNIIENGTYLKHLIKNVNYLDKLGDFFEEALIFRITGQYKSDFNILTKDFISYIFTLLKNGVLHREMSYQDLTIFLTKNFNGFPYLIQEIKKLELFKINNS